MPHDETAHQPPYIPMPSGAGDFFRGIAGYVKRHTAWPLTAIMFVVSIDSTAHTVQCRNPQDAIANGYNYSYLSSYSPTIGDKVEVANTGTGWIVQSKIA